MSRKLRSVFGRDRKLFLEPLERREVMAGTVTGSVIGGSLYLTGDSNDNFIVVTQQGNGSYAVSGVDFSQTGLSGQGFQPGATTIKGGQFFDFGPESFTQFTGVTNDIVVNLNGGNDVVAMGNGLDNLNQMALNCFGLGFSRPTVPDDNIDNEQLITPTTFIVPRNLIVNGGAGSDFVVVSANIGNATNHGFASIDLGSGDRNGFALGTSNQIMTDAVATQETVFGSTVAGFLNVFGLNGNDDVCLDSVSVGGGVGLALGNGSNEVSAFTLSAQSVNIGTGSGTDGVFMTNFKIGLGVNINTGGGKDVAAIGGAEIGQLLSLNTGSGDDSVRVSFISARNIFIDTGDGNDGDLQQAIDVSNVVVSGNLTVNTGTGNDRAYLHSLFNEPSTIGGNVNVDMNSGNDVLEIVALTVGGNLNVSLGAGTNRAGIGVAPPVGEEEEPGLSQPVIAKNLFINGGPNNNSVNFGNLRILNDLFAAFGAGKDVLDFNGVQIGRDSNIDVGGGDDNVTINFANVVRRASFFMGAGNDKLNIFNSAAAYIFARGGIGTDTLTNNVGIPGNGRNAKGDVQEFEKVVDQTMTQFKKKK